MKLLKSLTIKNLKLNKKRTIVTIVGIMLSVALITAVATMYASGIESLIKFEVREKGNFHVSYYDVPVDEIGTFKNNRAIEDIYITQNVGYAKLDESKNEDKPYAYVKSFSKGALENLSVKLVEGRLPENENEIIIPTHLKTNGRVDLKIGDTITLNVGKRVDSDGYELTQNNPLNVRDKIDDETQNIENEVQNVDSNSNEYEISEELINTVSKTYKIVGIIERPASNIEEYSAPGYTFITYFDDSNIEKSKVDIYTKYTKEGVKNASRITANIIGVDADKYEKYCKGEVLDSKEVDFSDAKYDVNFNGYLIDLQTNPILNSSVGGLSFVVAIVCGIIVFTSVFCIKNSFDISITEKTKQYGMLRSIGATKKQIRNNVFFEATALGLIGIPLGIIFGLIASSILVVISNYLIKDTLAMGLELVFSFSWWAMLIAIILGIITIYLSAFRSSIRASKVSPIESIRNSANIKIKSKKLKSPKIIKKLFGIGGEISYKNLKRNKRKYRATVISIAVSVFVFISLSSFMNMFFGEVQNELNISDYNIKLYVRSQDDIYNKILETTKFEGVEDYTVQKSDGYTFKNPKYSKEYEEFHKDIEIDRAEDYSMITSIGDHQYRKYIKELGLNYEDIKNKGIFINYKHVAKYDQETQKTVVKYLKAYDYNKGDKISGKLRNDKNCSIEIGYLTDKVPFGLQEYGTMIVVSDEMFESIDKLNDVKVYYKSSNPDGLQDEIENLLNNVNCEIDIYNIAENVRIMNNLVTLIGIFLYGFIIVISLIGVTNIFNTITTNMELRKQEFASLKSIGMTKHEFSRMIRLESVFMGVKALAFGIPIGVILSYIMYHYLAENSGAKYEPPFVAILICVVAVFLLISALMRYSISKINKQNTIETIRNENI